MPRTAAAAAAVLVVVVLLENTPRLQLMPAPRRCCLPTTRQGNRVPLIAAVVLEAVVLVALAVVLGVVVVVEPVVESEVLL